MAIMICSGNMSGFFEWIPPMMRPSFQYDSHFAFVHRNLPMDHHLSADHTRNRSRCQRTHCPDDRSSARPQWRCGQCDPRCQWSHHRNSQHIRVILGTNQNAIPRCSGTTVRYSAKPCVGTTTAYTIPRCRRSFIRKRCNTISRFLTFRPNSISRREWTHDRKRANTIERRRILPDPARCQRSDHHAEPRPWSAHRTANTSAFSTAVTTLFLTLTARIRSHEEIYSPDQPKKRLPKRSS